MIFIFLLGLNGLKNECSLFGGLERNCSSVSLSLNKFLFLFIFIWFRVLSLFCLHICVYLHFFFICSNLKHLDWFLNASQYQINWSDAVFPLKLSWSVNISIIDSELLSLHSSIIPSINLSTSHLFTPLPPLSFDPHLPSSSGWRSPRRPDPWRRCQLAWRTQSVSCLWSRPAPLEPYTWVGTQRMMMWELQRTQQHVGVAALSQSQNKSIQSEWKISFSLLCH